MAFLGKILYPTAMIDKESYPRIETGYLFTPDKEKEFFQQFITLTFTQFKYQASAILRKGYSVPRNVIFQHLPVSEEVFSDGKRQRCH